MSNKKYSGQRRTRRKIKINYQFIWDNLHHKAKVTTSEFCERYSINQSYARNMVSITLAAMATRDPIHLNRRTINEDGSKDENGCIYIYSKGKI